MPESLEEKVDALSPADIAFVFDETSSWSARFGLLLYDQIPIEPGVEALDLGCGTGYPTFALAHAHGASSRFTGVDVWEEALARAERKRSLLGARNIRFVRGDAGRLPFGDARFDLIVSNVGINNFPEPRVALFECARVARPGARLVFTTNLNGHMREFYEAYRDSLTHLGLTRYLEPLRQQEEHRRSKEIFVRWTLDAGFEVRRTVEETFQLRYENGRALLGHPLTRIGFLDGWRGILDADDVDRVFAAIETRLDEIAQREGELRMTVPMFYLEAQRER